MSFLDPIVENLGVNWKLFLAQLINFGIVFFLISKYAFGPIQKALGEREKKIKKGLEDAKKAETEIEMAEQKYREKVKQARLEANKIVAQAHRRGENIVAKSVETAEKRAEETILKAKEEVRQEKKKMLSEVKEDVVSLSILIAEKLLHKNLDREQNEEIINKLIK
jgi:F-type H+-transporting ATPase subunit b